LKYVFGDETSAGLPGAASVHNQVDGFVGELMLKKKIDGFVGESS
jgi:hypothetical protein